MSDSEDAVSSKDYQYEPLSEGCIRLVHLLPGKKGDELKCSLTIVALDDAPVYEAVSYCWGDPDPPAYINCGEGLVRITTNLASGLQQIRRKDKTRVLWADQICINQQDIAERSAQVNIMGQIFKRARRVVVWLGQDEEDDPQAPLANEIIEGLASISHERHGERPQRDSLTDSELTAYGLPSFGARSWNAFNTFVDLPYWCRMWIFQELVLSTEHVLLWGTTVMKVIRMRHNFVMSLGWMLERGLEVDKNAATNMAVAMWSRGWKEESLLELAKISYGRRCKDQRDLIYALIGIPQLGSLIVADYSSSIADVYTSAAYVFLQQTPDSLQFLSHAGTHHLNHWELADFQSWPSWVPNWTVEHFTTIGHSRHPFVADAKLPPNVHLTASGVPKILRVDGVRFQRVCKVNRVILPISQGDQFAESDVYPQFISTSEFYRETISEQNGPQHLFSLVETFLGGSYMDFKFQPGGTLLSYPPHTAYEDLTALVVFNAVESLEAQGVGNLQDLRARLRVADTAICAAWLCAPHDSFLKKVGLPLGTDGVPNISEIKTLYWNAMNRSSDPFTTLTERTQVALSSLAWDDDDAATALLLIEELLCVGGDRERFTSTFVEQEKRRQYFVTDNRTFGKGPPAMQEDDVVMILFGARVPFVLRPTNVDGEYRLIGECYVDGNMHGEFVEQLKAKGAFEESVTTFNLV